jgi:pimeloyl-ACP methyl ester carboxylesterase
MARMPVARRRMALPSWMPVDVWPFELSIVDVNSVSVAVTDTGAGPVLLFCTGIGSFIWRDVMMRLSRAFRCVTLDPPGIGFSAPIERGAGTLQNASRAIGGVIDALDLRDITLIVHDSAGPPSFAAAARTPDRMSAIVAVNTFGWRPAGAAFRVMLAFMGSSAVRSFSIASGALSRVTATPFGVGRHLDAKSRDAYRAGLQKSMRSFHDYLNDARNSDIYGEVERGFAGPLAHVPFMTIFGERNDPLGFQPQWKARFPDARQLVIPQGNHFPMCDAPQFVADHIAEWHRESIAEKLVRRS